MKISPMFVVAPLLLFGASTLAQVGSGDSWPAFGPDRGAGAFLNITRRHLTSQNAQGIAVDPQQRILVLNEWDESTDAADCAVSRHIKNARLLDMAYTGPEELEGTRKIAMNLGGTNYDVCNAIAGDSLSRAVVVGVGDYGNFTGSGFIVRLTASGAYDTSFSSDGKFALKNSPSLADLATSLNHVVIDASNRPVACGSVVRGNDQLMLAVRFTTGGTLDSSFGSGGVVELSFNALGDDADSCQRLTLLPDGDMLLGGMSNDAAGSRSFGLARLNSNGSLDTGFSSDGKVVVGTGSQLSSARNLAGLGYDPARDRYVVAGNINSTIVNAAEGFVFAVRDSGSLDTGFNANGRKFLRFSSYGFADARAAGETSLQRLLLRDDGAMYLMGTHYNAPTDLTSFGASDMASMRLEADGSVITIANGPNTYADKGVRFHAFTQLRHANRGNQPIGYAQSQDRFADERMVDATWYGGNLLVMGNRPRYWDTVFDHDGDGNLDEPGPVAPLVAAINTERLFSEDFDFDGLDASVPLITSSISVPAGYGNYCSVSNPSSPSGYGLLPQGAGSDPCQQFLDSNPNLVIERSGIYSMSGFNQVIGTCSGGYVTIYVGSGTTPFDQAFAASTGRSGCVFTAVPNALAIFSRPYSGAHTAGTAQSFNHDPYLIPIGVAQFGQSAGTYDACYIDNRGRQRSTGNPNASPSTCAADSSGVDEAAVDILVDGSRTALAMASGWISMAVPRLIPRFTPAGKDPYQREMFVRHRVGSGRYAEVFTAYYAHMQDTAVRRGELVSGGTVLGQIGDTGASGGEHLHIGVHRNKNLSYRKTFEFNFSGGVWDRDGRVSAIDPWGWAAPQGADPWAWRFGNVYPDNPELDDSGSFSSWMWLSGEAPTMF